MFCYICGAKVEPIQKVIDYDNGSERVNVVYCHCGRNWALDDRGVVIASGLVKEKGEKNENQKTN